MFHKVRSLKEIFLIQSFLHFPLGNIILLQCLHVEVGRACAVLSHVRFFVTPWTVARQAPLFMGFFFFQARILEWVAISFSRGSSWFRDQTCVSCIADRLFTTEPMGQPQGYKSGTNKEKSLLRQTARNECPGELTDLPSLKGQMGSRQTLRQQAVWVSGGQLWC